MADQSTQVQEPNPTNEIQNEVAAEAETKQSTSTEGVIGLSRIQQLKVKVQAVLGTTPLSIAELANLEKGDIIKLDTKIGDSISILANGDEIARAEIVVTQDTPPRFGLTLTEIIDTQISAQK